MLRIVKSGREARELDPNATTRLRSCHVAWLGLCDIRGYERVLAATLRTLPPTFFFCRVRTQWRTSFPAKIIRQRGMVASELRKRRSVDDDQ